MYRTNTVAIDKSGERNKANKRNTWLIYRIAFTASHQFC